MDHRPQAETASSPHHGVATLEFVMSMPVVLTMFALLMWLGLSVVGQSEVTIQARHKAWKQRFDDKSGQPLIFPTAEGFYELQKDFAAGEATKNINAAPIFSRMPKPQAATTVLAGSWDYHALPLKKPPHWRHHALVVANSYTGTLQSLIGQLGGDPLDFLIGAAGNFAQKRNESSSAMNDDGGGGSGAGGGGSTGGVPGGGGTGQQTKEQEQKTKAQREAEKRQLTERRAQLKTEQRKIEGDNPFNPLGGELGEAREAFRLAQLSDDPNESEEDRKKRLARLEAKVDLLKIKRDRLRMQLDDVNEDLEALG